MQELGDRKQSKGYRDGILQGKKTLARELSQIISKHLTVRLKPEKQLNFTRKNFSGGGE